MNGNCQIVKADSPRHLADALHVRRSVFVEEQGVPEALEVDEHDALDRGTVHFVAYMDGLPVGAGRLRPYDGGGGKVERVAVLQPARGTGIGRKIMLAIERAAREAGFRQLKLNAQIHARRFYEKLGYEPYGEPFEEAGIAHIAMAKELDA